MLLTMIGIVSGSVLINSLIWLICVGLVFYLLFWLVGFIGLPQPFDKVIRVVLGVAAVIVLINVIMSFAGSPYWRWNGM